MQSQKWQNDLCFQGKSFIITVIQICAPTSSAEKAELEWFYEDVQELIEITPPKRWSFQYRGLECNSRKSTESEVFQSCLTLCNPMDYSLPGSSVRGLFQARVLEWVAISFSRGSSQPRDWTWVSCIADRRFTIWVTREALRDTWNYRQIWTWSTKWSSEKANSFKKRMQWS